MLDLLIIIAALVLGIAFFRVEGEGRGLAIQFPTATNQKGFKTRTNGYIVLVIMAGAILFVYSHSTNLSLGGLILILLSALIVVSSFKKSKK